MFHWFPAAYLNWGLAFGPGQQEEHRNHGRTTRPAIADGPSSAAREVSSGYFSGRTNHSPIFGRICNLSNFRIHILVLENLQAENGDPRKVMLLEMIIWESMIFLVSIWQRTRNWWNT